MILTPESCKNLSDNELAAKSLENVDYFSCLFQRYEKSMLRYIRRISAADEETAHDILQEAFIKIWRNLNSFDKDLAFSSWVYRIVHNETISIIRKSKSFGKNKTTDINLYNNVLSDEEDHITENVPDAEYMVRMISDLPLKYKEVMILKFVEGKSYEEISDILKMPEGTIAIRISRAKKIIRKIIDN